MGVFRVYLLFFEKSINLIKIPHFFAYFKYYNKILDYFLLVCYYCYVNSVKEVGLVEFSPLFR